MQLLFDCRPWRLSMHGKHTQEFRLLSFTAGAIGIFLMSLLSNGYAATELAKINNTVITVDEFNKRFQENLRYFQIKAPTKQAVLDDLIKRELGIQEAKKLGLDKDPEIADRINTVLYHALLEKKLSKDLEKIHITDDEAREYYKRNPEIRTSHIFVSLPISASEDAEKKALAKIKEIQTKYIAPNKMSFSEVAQKFSEGPTAALGGDLDFQTRERLDPTYYDEAVKLGSPGKVSGIVRSQFGFHIIKLTGLRRWDEANKPKIKQLVFEEKRTKMFENYMNQLKKQAQISTRPELLKD